MESLEITEIIKKLNSKEIPLFNLDELGGTLNIDNRQSLYKRVSRLGKKGILKMLTKGKYAYALKETNDFVTANFMYQPSYISMQSALSLHSIMTGFSYQITSLTPRKSKNIIIKDKTFSYSKINPKLFWGFENKDGFLIATPEKALLDYIYFAGKGLNNLDWDEIDIGSLDKKLLLAGASKFNAKVIKEIKKHI
jgi:predicted transcriptional regulator of viral defense system